MTLVGCIGGGQLGRMLAIAGAPLGVRFRFLDPSPDACAGQVGELVVGAYDDPEALGRLTAGAAAVTFEFENVPVEAAERAGVVPGARALAVGQDRLREKELFRRLGISTARFGTVAETGLPALVKSRRLGYDGKGQRRIDEDEPLDTTTEIAEEVVRFDRELSVIGVRGRDGETRFWPLAENVHRDGILAVSRTPVARHAEDAEDIARRIMEELEYVGVLAVELFETEGRLLANEFAPRVHNTGHWTIDGSSTSQFENHVRAILGLPLGPTDGCPSVMVNIVGGVPPLERLLAMPGASVHLYGKAPRAGRKLGHVTLVGAPAEVVDETIALAASAWR